MPTLLPLWRATRTTGKQCGLTATGDYQPSLRSPWLAAIDIALKLVCIDLLSSIGQMQCTYKNPKPIHQTGRLRIDVVRDVIHISATSF
ncbi:MAG: hypothetical protein ROD09_09320 [Candidatus Sedimenticola sp. (ex Thyasira tokunagai)]